MATVKVLGRFRHWLALALALACFGALAAAATGSPVGVFKPVGGARQDVHQFMQFVADPSGRLTVDQVAAGQAGAFRAGDAVERISFGEGVFWAKLEIDLSDYREPQSYLLLDPHPLGRIEVFYPTLAGGFGSTAIDANDTLERRRVAVRVLLFPVPTPVAAEKVALYVRFEQRFHPLYTHMAWVSGKAALEETADAHLWQGVLFGALCTLVLYNAFLLFTTRDRAYLLYVYYLTCFTIMMSLMTGMKLSFLPFSASATALVVVNGCVVHGGMWFFRMFLDLRQTAPRINRLLQAIQWAAIAPVLLAITGPTLWAYQLSIVIILPAMFALMLASVERWRQGFAPAKFSVIGLSVHAIVTTVFVAKFIKLAPDNFVTIYWVEAAAVWEALCFSFALAYRVRLAEQALRNEIDAKQVALQAEHAALAEARAADAEKNTFLSMISHELRSPLQSIVAALDVEKGNHHGPAMQAFLRKIRWAAERIDSQLRDLFILSVGEAGKLEMRAEPFEVGEVVEAVIEAVSETAKTKGVKLKVEAPKDLLFVVADPKRIEQVIANLVENAVKYTAKGSVTVTYGLVGHDQLQLIVADTGIGISKEHQGGLFVPYRRFGTVERERNSTGIGLAVVKTLLAHLGGTVSVESEVGKGSTFTVKVPVAITQEFDSKMDASDGRHLLIVDDRNDVLDALCSIGAALGYTCDRAESAAVAANLLGSRVYDVVLIDLDMPVKNGCELASETRRGEGPNSGTRLIAMSAGTAEACGLNGGKSLWPFDGFIEKPIAKDQLLQLVETPSRVAAA